jgi:hypothetical protein
VSRPDGSDSPVPLPSWQRAVRTIPAFNNAFYAAVSRLHRLLQIRVLGAGARLGGIYVIRTSVPASVLGAAAAGHRVQTSLFTDS